jgi:hypothetical protein
MKKSNHFLLNEMNVFTSKINLHACQTILSPAASTASKVEPLKADVTLLHQNISTALTFLHVKPNDLITFIKVSIPLLKRNHRSPVYEYVSKLVSGAPQCKNCELSP